MSAEVAPTSLALKAALDEVAADIDRRFDLLLTVPDDPRANLYRAMRHAAIGGGKRLRPLLVTATASLFGVDRSCAVTVATAIECIHVYSLVHDDLPAMDDDDLRRGQPTVHIAFDEATAILAGDALLTLSFGLVAGEDAIDADARLDLVRLLSREAGAAGMVGGQVLDLAAEGETLAEVDIARMQAMKTGALIAFACEAGPTLARAAPEDRARLRRFGEIVGLAFQLADDLLDETADAAALGKATGKDRARGKKTLPALHGHDWTREKLAALVEEAASLLAPYGDKAAVLIEAARFIADRKN